MTRTKLISIVASVVALLIVFSILAGMWVPKVDSTNLAEQRTEAPETMRLTLTTSPEYRYFSGQVYPRQTSSLSSRITARVAEVLVNAGDSVQAGDVLLRLENDDLSARVRQQQQALAAAQARVNEARTSFQRVEALVAERLLPQAALDEARASKDTSEAELNGAREALSEAQTSESFSVITAPYSGIISERSVYTGDIATPGMRLVSMYAPTSLRLEVHVSESILSELQLGDTLTADLTAIDASMRAVVTEIEPAADPGSRSFTVKLELADTAGLYPGMYGQISVVNQMSEQLWVPKAYVLTIGQLDYLDVFSDGRTERRIVKLGEEFQRESGEYVQVLSGVTAGESVVIP
ncbi:MULTISPECIES: efflux RND transporter periplasmic adaptor subunit [Gammaproteobacteria]|uniref:efflux RND transporter periplasmic adaptor subunit n=1 Tax=Gammaproteobacteria TaxID=1236 RepID=UPI000DD05B5B|nr:MULTISPECIES: efflux RND transporter periplasmic adaptor subunit [Gammaproteobacteria]RTE87518.1 efflux RND transporter periplasmic adaptor subunit [Aliidiomarina sp. B3213]TCZ92697.1 efflux RND transporter periplasmic adaptor subunit [Lysobacter sp. N42]